MIDGIRHIHYLVQHCNFSFLLHHMSLHINSHKKFLSKKERRIVWKIPHIYLLFYY